MGDYRITFARSARQELEQLDGPLVNQIFPKHDDSDLGSNKG